MLPLTNHDASVRLTLLEILHLLRSPTALLHPGIIIPVARQMLKNITLSLLSNEQNMTDTKFQN